MALQKDRFKVFFSLAILIAFLFLFTAEISPLSVNAGSKVTIKVTFTSNTTWVVPTGVTSITIKAWGAGGGGGGTSGNIAGGGGYFEGTIDVTPAETLTIRVGGGGQNGGSGGTNGGANAGATNPGSGGGAGYTGVFRSTVDQNGALIMAGGGGGGGNILTIRDGGGGGGLTGTTCANPCGDFGTQSAGGVAGSSGSPGDGVALGGGVGGSAAGNDAGGGGGAGYWGGAGGQAGTGSGVGGGGGSGFATTTATDTTLTQGVEGGSGGAGANQGDVDYPGAKGDGGDSGSNGEDGYITILHLGSAITLTTDVSVTIGASILGSISKGSGTFVIDHPLDPENKLLFHSFVESPDVKNIYDGIATLNEVGEATVELPDYFEALNKDFRYLLTPIQTPAPDLYIKDFVTNNRFTIAGGTQDVKVSWQVTGIRKDPFIIANPIIVEVEKGINALIGKGEYFFEGYEK